MNRDQIEAVRAVHRIEEVVRDYVELRPSGRCLIGRCPFHEDRRPSLTLFPHTQTWWCFACNIGGDVFDFLQRIERISFREAVERLAGPSFQEPVRKRQPPNVTKSNGQPAECQLTSKHFSLLTAAMEVYHAALFSRPDQLRYLARRGLDGEAVREYQLGYSTGHDLARHLRYRGWNPEIARDLGLVGPHGEYFRERIIIPERRDGQVVYLVGRATRSVQRAKYLGLPGAPKPLYGAEYMRGAKEAYLVEGPFDWLTLLSWGYPARALLGSHLKREHERELDSLKRVYLVLDNDTEGRKATDELAQRFSQRTIQVVLPLGIKDVNELGQRPNGRELFTWLVKAGKAR